jgi:epoxyqueuosine reductase
MGCDTIRAVTNPAVLVTAAGSGLDRIGWTTAEAFPDVRSSLDERIANGMSARLGFTFSDPERATTPAASWPWARSIVVGLRSYLPDAGTPAGPGRVARFAETDHYIPLREGMERVARALEDGGYRAEVVIDDSRLVDRAAAHRAGLAWWGKNTMLLTPGLGPWFLIGCVLTDAHFPPTEQMTRDCGTCEACLPACPTNALVRPGILDARRCLAAILQAPGEIPEDLRPHVGDRVYGCDDCIEACPPGSRMLQRSIADRGSVDPVTLLEATDEQLLDRYGHFYIPRRHPRFLRRNALVVVGNIGDERHLPLLAGYLRDPDPLLQDHARWAIERIGGPAAAEIIAADQVRDDPIGE